MSQMRFRSSCWRSRQAPRAAVAMLLASGCSLVLDWTPDGQPCGDDQSCPAGTSCLVTTCIADGSVAAAQTCSRDQQCGNGLVCTPRPSVCREPCAAYFEPVPDCEGAAYCRPSAAPGGEDTRGSCVASECSTSDDCEPGTVCVRVTELAGACLRPCSPTLEAGYADDCAAAVDGPEPYCQPLGVSGPTLVCLEESAVTGADFAACDLGGQSCARGAACVNGECRPYCDPAFGGQPCPGSCAPSDAVGGESLCSAP